MEISENAVKMLSAIALFMLLVVIGIFASESHAAGIRCWAQNTIIYNGKGDDVRYDGEMLTFLDRHTHRPVFVFGNCVVRIDKSDDLVGDKHHAAKARKEEHRKKH